MGMSPCVLVSVNDKVIDVGSIRKVSLLIKGEDESLYSIMSKICRKYVVGSW